jgi:hypothetical protein
MALQPTSWVSPEPDAPSLAEYASLYALLLAVAVAQLVLTSVSRTIANIVPVVLSARLFGTAAATLLAMAGLGVAYAALTRVSDVGLDWFELARIGLSLTGLLLVAFYYLHSTVSLPVSEWLAPAIATAVMGLLAGAYARASGFDLRLSLPSRNAAPVVAGAVLGPVLVVAAAVGVAAVVPTESMRWLRGTFLSAQLISTAGFLQDTVVPVLVGAVGTGLVFFGAVQESLRQNAPSGEVVAVVTVLVGTYRLAVTGTLGFVTDILSFVPVAVGIGLVLLVAALVGSLWTALDPSLPDTAGPGVAALLGFAVVSLLAVVVQLAVSDLASLVSFAVAQTAVVGIAAVAYDRTRSVWVPVLSFAAFQLTAATVQQFQLVSTIVQ